MRFVYTFIIAIYGVMNYSLLIPHFVAFFAKLNEMYKIKFHFALEVSFSIQPLPVIANNSTKYFILNKVYIVEGGVG